MASMIIIIKQKEKKRKEKVLRKIYACLRYWTHNFLLRKQTIMLQRMLFFISLSELSSAEDW